MVMQNRYHGSGLQNNYNAKNQNINHGRDQIGEVINVGRDFVRSFNVTVSNRAFGTPLEVSELRTPRNNSLSVETVWKELAWCISKIPEQLQGHLVPRYPLGRTKPAVPGCEQERTI
ncbi:hypothetical protein AAF712_012437 [Marasmius tenuissimus]|uniref:Uncharacterized protein n=1 Tax=Marasmius tenuissimus TaxID=585030 RepID=A0ABR2ZIL4_9AGAR